MKGFLSALIILAVLFSFLLFYNIYITTTLSSLTDSIHLIQKALIANDFDEAKLLSEKLYANLQKDSEFLYYVTDRAPIDNAISECAQLISFIETKDLSEAYATSFDIETILKKTCEKSTLRLFFNKPYQKTAVP